jgi:hypothetical protein
LRLLGLEEQREKVLVEPMSIEQIRYGPVVLQFYKRHSTKDTEVEKKFLFYVLNLNPLFPLGKLNWKLLGRQS